MEQVLYRLHVRLLTVTNRVLPYSVRRTVEFAALIAAISCLASLIILHITYVLNSSSPNLNCILTALDTYSHHNFNSTAIGVDTKELVGHMRQRYDLIALKIAKDPLLSPSIDSSPGSCLLDSNNKGLDGSAQYCLTMPKGIALTEYTSTAKNYSKRSFHQYLFSFQRGNLMLTQELDSSTVFQTLDIQFHHESECFGPPTSKWLSTQTHGLYDVIVMNWAINAFGGAGYLYNLKSKELFNLNYAADFNNKKGVNMNEMGRRESYKDDYYFSSLLKHSENTVIAPFVMVLRDRLRRLGDFLMQGIPEEVYAQIGLPSKEDRQKTSMDLFLQLNQFLAFRVGVVFSTTFIFFISSTLVSYVLRETQERMLRFTFLLQYHITNNLPYLPLIFTHVVGSLVFVPIIMGIYFFMFEFFSDQLLAFLVLLIVWMGEVFSVLSLRSTASIRYFPNIFCCYFYMFHVYFFNYPFGFCYLALLTTVLFVLHSMIHFWNVYEVPTFERGLLSPGQPRQGIITTMPVHERPAAGVASPQSNGNLGDAGNTAAEPAVRTTPGRPALATRQISEDWETPPSVVFNGRVSHSTTRVTPIQSTASNATSTSGSDRSPAVEVDSRPRSNSTNTSHRPVVNIYESVEARRVRLQAAKDNPVAVTGSPNRGNFERPTKASSNPNTPYQSSSSDNIASNGNAPSAFPSIAPNLANPSNGGGRRPRSSSEGFVAPAWSHIQQQKSTDSNDDYGFFDDGDISPKSPDQSMKFSRSKVSYDSFGYDGSSKFTIFGNFDEDN